MTRRRFVIGVDGLTSPQEAQLREYISGLGAWWHWINNLWLLTTTSEEPEAAHIRDKIIDINPSAKCVIFEFPEDITWAATGTKNSQGKKLADWIRSPWGDEP
jgi:hypothetical protein